MVARHPLHLATPGGVQCGGASALGGKCRAGLLAPHQRGRELFVDAREFRATMKRNQTMRGLRIGRVGTFLLLTFALSWGFDLLIAVTIGHEAYLELGVSPLGMFFPAFVALILQLFVFKDSPVHFQHYQGKPRWILYGFLLLTIIYAIVTLIGILVQGRSGVFQGVGNLLTTLWTLLVLFVAGQSSREELQRAGLQLGDTKQGVKFILGVVVFFALQA